MSERLRLFLLPEYRLQGMEIKNEESEKYSGSKYEPVFTILSREAEPKPTGNPELIFFTGTLLATLVTAFMYATDVNSLNPLFLEKAMTAATGSVDGAAVSVEALLAGREVVGRLLPIAFGLVGLQAVHDLGHFIAAKNHDTKLSLPYLVPSLQIGLFGTITNFLTFPKTRKAIFDISIAGPALGFLFSLACTVYGFALTAGATPDLLATFPALPAAFLDSSFLLHEMANQFLHSTGVTDITPALTPVHPLVAVGMTGLLTNAFNFLPIGRLDGGRVAMAVGGRQSADSIAFITLIGQSIMFLTNASPISFFWILVVVFLQRGADIPPIDDVTPVATEKDDEKKSLGWIGRALTLAFCAGLTGATILPVPQSYDQQQQQQQIQQAQSSTLAPSPSQAPGASNILQGLMGPGKISKPGDI